MRRVRTREPGVVTVSEGNGEDVTGAIGGDGRFKVQFHDNLEALNSWLRRCRPQSSTVREAKEKPRQKSSVAPLRTEDDGGISGETTTLANPRLNIAIQIVGSRGDVQPFIPIAQLLMKPPFNRRVRICTHPVFKDFVQSQGVEFFSIGGDPEALMAYMVKNPGLLPNRGSVKAGDVGKRRKEMWEIMNGVWRSCIEAGDGMGGRIPAANVSDPKALFIADAIIANPLSMAHIHCAEKLGIPLHMVFTMPWSPTDAFPHPLAAMNYGSADPSTANYLSFIMMELLTWEGLGDLINKLRTQVLALDHISPMWGFQLLSRLRVPYTYLWSQALIPKPADWGSHINIAGFSFLPLANSYTPPDHLVHFLDAGEPPIYIGFGSIVVDDPDALTKLVFDAVKSAGVRAIVSKGWGGFGGKDVPENVYLIGNCPHDWLFQRVSAVVHHGGAGTTAAGIAAGRPTVVVPFFGDQPFWGQMMARTGAGPDPVLYKDLTAEKLADSIKFALTPKAQDAALTMARDIAEEDGAGDAVKDFFYDRWSCDNFRCDMFPERLAIWKHRRTGAHLSGFVVACLVDQQLIQPHDLRLIRRKHWYVDEGAEHPFVGFIGAFTGLIAALSTATGDYSTRLKTRTTTSPPKDELHPPVTPPPKTSQSNDKATTDSEGEASKAVQGHDGFLKDFLVSNTATPAMMQLEATKMARKTTRAMKMTPGAKRIERSVTSHEKRKASWRAKEQGRHGRAYYVTRATGHYAADVFVAGLKTPVALFYNVANGFRNYPSYGYGKLPVRQRDEITGLGSGLQTAGKEFALCVWDAFRGIPLKPYAAIKEDGAKGIGKGLYFGFRDFFCNWGAAIFGLPGYNLKGIEKECSKHNLTKLKAEILLIRLRQGMDDFRQATPEERKQVVDAWKAMKGV